VGLVKVGVLLKVRKMEKNIKIRKQSFLLIFLICIQLTVPLQAGSREPVKVGVYQNAPLTLIDENGKAKGFFIDILEDIANREAWGIEYVRCSFSECLDKLEKGEIDLLGVIAYSKYRGKKFDYTLESVTTNWGQMYINKETDIESIIDLVDRKVAVLHGDIYFEDLKRLVDRFGIKCRFIEAFEYEDVLKLVEIGRCKAGLVSQIYGIQHEGDYNISKSSILVSPQKLYWATPKGKNKDLLYTLDRYLGKLKDDEQSIYYEAISKWFGIGVKSELGRWFKFIITGFVGLLAIFFTAGLILRLQVKSKTKELRIKNEELVKEIKYRKQAKEALRESEERFRKLSAAAEEGIAIHDKGLIVDANEALAKIFGYELSEMTGMYAEKLATPESWKTILKHISSGYDKPYEAIGVRKDGSTFPCQLVGKSYQYGGKTLRVATFRDVTEQKRAEDALRESEEKYRNVLDSIEDGYYEVNLAGDFIFFNDSMCKILSYPRDELLGMNNREYMDQENAKKIYQVFNKVFNTGISTRALDWKLIRKDGSECFVETVVSLIKDSEGQPSGFRGIARDVTERKYAEKERKRLEDKLYQTERIESLGTLAGGIAHDFNNLLMGIQGRTSLMLMDADFSHPHFEHLKGIEDYVKSAADLTKQLLGFARSGKYEVKTTDLNDLIKNQTQMFGRTRKEINIHEKFERILWTSDVDRGQIEQVLLNLYVNAWHAMPGGGDLYIQTENIEIDENYSKLYHVEPGKYVKISVADTGVGMDEAARKRIFDPFFTTKEMGRGSGLGLASAYGIIKNHGGFIDVYGDKGEGSTFVVYLPASKKEVVKEKKHHQELLKGTETVLLVDDESMIIAVGREIIENFGYEVLIAKNGKEAIKVYQKNRDKVDIVILDMVMPEMGGGETYDKLKEIDPDVKVLLSSGYSIDGQAAEIMERGCDGFIQKPFNMIDLSQRIRKILEKT